MKQCTNCGKSFEIGSKFCPYCGNKQSLPDPLALTNPGLKTENKWKDTFFSAIRFKMPLILRIINIVWITGFFVLLLFASGTFVKPGEAYGHSSGFWPFAIHRFSLEDLIDHFDLSEFIVFSLLPFALWSVSRLFKHSGMYQKYKIHPEINIWFSPAFIGTYMIWIFLNFFVFIGVMDNFDYFQLDGPGKFWPLFKDAGFDSMYYYDITELLAYTGIPLALIILAKKGNSIPAKKE